VETERQLLEAIRGGERAALRRLYDRYSGYAMAIGLRYVPERDEVRDVIQDSFVRILTTIGQFDYRGEGSLKSWVSRIVSNRAVDYLRQHQRFLTVDTIPDEPDIADEPDIGGIPPDVLTAMIGRLPPNYRTVLNLYVFEQQPHREIARMLGIKESTSSSLFFRAKKLLARNIKEYLKSQET
jgi:RNA polymerase sigma-70 factor (ECF subfamily)